MGRTIVVAAALTVSVNAAAQQPAPTPAPTPTPAQTAPELFKQGQEAASRGDFATAIGVYQRALEMDPTNWQIELALADAERQSNQCDKAALRYKRLFDTVPESDRDRVKTSAMQCPNIMVLEAPPKAAPLPPPAPPPKIVEREGTVSWVTVGVLAGAGACLGSSIALYFAGRSSQEDADVARSAKDHDRLQTRGDYQLIASGALMAGAIGLGVYGLYKVSRTNKAETEVAVTPTGDGGAVFVRGAW